MKTTTTTKQLKLEWGTQGGGGVRQRGQTWRVEVFYDGKHFVRRPGPLASLLLLKSCECGNNTALGHFQC